jgi:hypothetical protein
MPTTTDHDVIRKWIEQRDGRPARVRGTEGEDGGIIRVDYPGYEGEALQTISWEEFFEAFEKNELAFLFQDKKKDGSESRFSKMISRNPDNDG